MKFIKSLTIFLILIFGALTVIAQTTAFTYQGKLTQSGNVTTALYDMQFRLFDNPNAGQGTQQGATVTNPSVQTTDGIFTVQLDFGSAVFTAGANLYLEVSVRPAGSGGGYSSLAPRPPLTSAPYSIKSLQSLNAENLGGVAAGNYLPFNGDGSNLTGVAKLGTDNVFTGADNSFPQITLSGDGQIIAPRLENSATDPAPASASNIGRVYFNTADQILKISNGTVWQNVVPRIVNMTYLGSGSWVCGASIVADQVLTFTKVSNSSRLKITYTDDIAASSGSINNIEIFRVLSPGLSGITPFRMVYSGGLTATTIHPQMEGYYTNIPAGTITLGVFCGCSGPGCSVTVTRPSGGRFLLEVTEVP